MKYLMVMFLGFSVYLLIWLSSVGFQYRIYLDYTNALFKASYLDTTIYSVILILYLTTREKINIVSGAITLYLLFITLISGSRFAILFLVLTIFLFILFSIKKINRITVKGVLASFFVFVAVIVGLIITIPKIDVAHYFSYSAFRMEKLLVGDNSIAARIKLINKSLQATDFKYITWKRHIKQRGYTRSGLRT